MPTTYNQQTNPSANSHSSSNSSSTLTIQDADSSIVLSDLLRSGETSRLRRRGAVRLDNIHRHEESRTSNNTTASQDEEETYLELYCRECECDTPAHQPLPVSLPQTPFCPSPFPQPLPQPTNLNSKDYAFQSRNRERTLIHHRVMAQRLPHIDASLHVHPPSSSTYPPSSAQVIAFLIRASAGIDNYDTDTENGVMVWTSVSEPVEGIVIPMHYEDDPNETTETPNGNDSRFMNIDELARRRPGPISTACMCKREVVGCAVCGSPLGMRYTPCLSAMNKIFPPPLDVPSSPILPQGFIQPNSTYLPTSHARTPIDPDTIRHRSRVAEYLLSMTTPRSTRTNPSAAPSPPDTIHLTPELNNGIERGRQFEVSIFPRVVSSPDHRNTPTISRVHQAVSTSSRIQDDSPDDDENVPEQPNELADTETDTDNDTDDGQNDDHYRLPMITQTGHDSIPFPGDWTYETPTKHVYRFFAEAVIPERHSKGVASAQGLSPLFDWRKLYASLYGLGQRNDRETQTSNEDAGNRSSCG
ncbi:hypothetical protein DFH05DRAFT_1606644 [Lentinula detonsa]|uniref:Uncharacterized protein n=1 Tax=Lentinula detonsa TaxID=2804962 RepID=A0A9W8TZ70_9AGAR|nr:hypothetical protein DFH05DRAFT_1606644 [Lentinula detonsa]